MKILNIGIPSSSQIYLNDVVAVRKFVESYTASFGVSSTVGDLSRLSEAALSVLLKFLEEGVSSITCFASKDNLSPVLLSRFDVINKAPIEKVGNNSFSVFLEGLSNKERVFDIDADFLKVAPAHLERYLMWRRLDRSTKERMRGLL